MKERKPRIWWCAINECFLCAFIGGVWDDQVGLGDSAPSSYKDWKAKNNK